MRWTLRSRRPHARGDVLCTEPGRSHPCPDLGRGRFRKATSRTLNMYAGEKSDWAIVPKKRPNNGRQLPAEDVEGRARPKGNGRQAAAEPGNCVDPNGGFAPGDERVQTAQRVTFDPREEPGALAAHAGRRCQLNDLQAQRSCSGSIQAAAVAIFHTLIASLRNWRCVFREIKWRCV